MQQRLNCAWRYVSWNWDYGRALETLMCGLKRLVHGLDKIWPAMNWNTCQLTCGTLQDFLNDNKTAAWSLSDFRQQVQTEDIDHFNALQHVGNRLKIEGQHSTGGMSAGETNIELASAAAAPASNAHPHHSHHFKWPTSNSKEEPPSGMTFL